MLPPQLTYWTLTGTVLALYSYGGLKLLRTINLFFTACLSLVLVQPCGAASYAQYFDLSLLGDGYMSSSASSLTNGQLHGRFKLLGNEESYDLYFELGGGGLVGQRAENYFLIPQAYLHYKSLGPIGITVGRQVRSFSTLDEYWMLGDVQPLFRWDAIQPETQGLSGAFVDYKPSSNLELGLFGSPLFLPSQGPSFSVIDGKLTSGNPWFTRPVDILYLSSGAAYDLKYDIKTPEVSKIVFQPSWGTHLMVKTTDDAYWIRASYFQKTKNELATPFEGVLNIGNGDIGDITVHPRVVKHNVATLDLGYRGETWALTASGISESNARFNIEPNWIYPVYSDQYKVGLNLLTKLSSFHTLEFGGLRTFNNVVTVQGLGGAGNLDVFSYRNQYDNVADVRLTSVYSPRAHGFLFKTKFRWAYDYKSQTSLVSSEASYTPLKNLSLFAKVDLMGGQRTPGLVYNNLLVNYLNRDRGQVGVKYVF